ncbi:MAG TPA: SusC/RagA family TonB-linked outer membrane protein, partial [Anseongella sp.]|nr:SusC/RagA family TonB-linked outer membrane protein [Anseongella sp.]
AGKLPGLVAVQRSGQPGYDDPSLSIRGFGSALVVVDGVAGRDFSRLDPAEIESITILKDAASAAVYGVSGGNGVILVTTKQGVLGKPVFNYSLDYGLQHVTRYPRFVNSEEYAILKNEASLNLGGGPVYSQEEIEKFRNGTDPNYPNFDYYDYFVRDYAPQMNQRLTVRGGSENIKYFFLLGGITQESMWEGGGQDFSKYNFRSNVDAKINDNLSISVDIGANRQIRNNLIQDSYLMASWLQYSWPVFEPKTPDGKIASTNYGLTAYLDRDLTGYIQGKRNIFQGSLSLNYKIPFIEGLSARVKASQDLLFEDSKDWLKKYLTYNWDAATQTSVEAGSRGTDELGLYHTKSQATNIQASFNYVKSFAGLHNVNALLLYEESEYKADNFNAKRINYVVPIDQIFAGPDLGKTNGGGAEDDGRQSWVGRINYNYAERYLFEYSFRYDGSPRFPVDTRWGFFSGISGGWRISEEAFLKDRFSSLDNLKLRLSWGKLGNDNTGKFQYLTGFTYPSTSYILGGEVVTAGMTDTGTPNPFITWEES